MDFQRDLLALLHTFTNDTWRSSRLSCFRWVLTYFRLRPNFPFLNWLILRFSDRSMSFRFSDCEISPVYEEFCAIMDYHPLGEEFLALPPDPFAVSPLSHLLIERMDTRWTTRVRHLIVSLRDVFTMPGYVDWLQSQEG